MIQIVPWEECTQSVLDDGDDLFCVERLEVDEARCPVLCGEEGQELVCQSSEFAIPMMAVLLVLLAALLDSMKSLYRTL